MIKILEKHNCNGCYACFNVCPQKCISMEADREGFWYPKVDEEKCSNCGSCEVVCPTLHVAESEHTIHSYGCRSNNMSIRMDSSSGGVFSLFAEEIIDRGGIVFGAGFDEAFHVCHSHTRTKEGISTFRGSKYVQSKIGNTFEKTKVFLEQGLPVLFSGTPCQIAGIRSYLKKDYEGLFCIDLICHGVPSPLVWDKYINYRALKSGSKIKQIAFRRKNLGWKKYSVSILFENNKEYSKPLTQDVYLQGFLRNMYLRPSCHACRFKTIYRRSDITLADFWGIQNVLPELDDDKGTSLVLVHTEKGRSIFDQIKANMQYKEVEIDNAIQFNRAAVQSSLSNSDRESFFADLDRLPFNKLMKKHCQVRFITVSKNIVRRVFSKIRRLV